MNAFVIATEKEQIQGKALPFTDLGGRGMLLYVLLALEGAEKIKQIFVVGPKRETMKVLESAIFYCPFSKPIRAIDEETFLNMPKQQADQVTTDALFIPANLPLVTAAELEQFLAHPDGASGDVLYSCTPQKAMALFQQKDDTRPGSLAAPRSAHFSRDDTHFALGYLQRCSVKIFISKNTGASLLEYSERLLQNDSALDDRGNSFQPIILSSGGHSLLIRNEDDFKLIAPQFSAWHLKLNEERNIPGETSCPNPDGPSDY